MMKLINLTENFDLAREALQLYPHDTEGLDEALSHFRISSNAVYPFPLDGKLCFLRLAPVDEKTLEHVASEMELITCLRSQGFHAAEPMPDRDGRLCSLLHSKYGDYVVSAFFGVPGVSLEAASLDRDGILSWGCCLGQLHNLSASYKPSLPRPAWDETLTAERLQQLGAPEHILQECRDVFAELRKLSTTPDVYGVIHYDFESDNVFCEDGAITMHVIDFDDSMVGWYAMDMAVALDSVEELVHEAAMPLFLQGYRLVRNFTPEQEATLPLMRRYIRLRQILSLRHCLSQSAENPPEWMRNLQSFLTRRLTILERDS